VASAQKGSDGKLYAPMIDIKTGKTEYMSPQDLADTVLAFPGEMRKNTPYVDAMVKGVTQRVPREQVQFEMPHMENSFSPLTNMIPGKSALKGQRSSMGARYLAQALPLLKRESPLVQAGMPGQHMNRSFEDEYGKSMGAVYSE
jgi:intein/homing endonuclease